MKQKTQFIKGCILLPILASITLLFLFPLPAYAVAVAPVEAVPVTEALVLDTLGTLFLIM